jgi:putative transposase
LTSQGESAIDTIRSIGVTDATYYRWRQEYGRLKVDQVKRMKELEAENTRLRRAISDLTLEKIGPEGSDFGKVLSLLGNS